MFPNARFDAVVSIAVFVQIIHFQCMLGIRSSQQVITLRAISGKDGLHSPGISVSRRISVERSAVRTEDIIKNTRTVT